MACGASHSATVRRKVGCPTASGRRQAARRHRNGAEPGNRFPVRGEHLLAADIRHNAGAVHHIPHLLFHGGEVQVDAFNAQRPLQRLQRFDAGGVDVVDAAGADQDAGHS
jgi:hypothetical protein